MVYSVQSDWRLEIIVSLEVMRVSRSRQIRSFSLSIDWRSSVRTWEVWRLGLASSIIIFSSVLGRFSAVLRSKLMAANGTYLKNSLRRAKSSKNSSW